ncbi:MAG TPA: NADP-dependent oxidoreductase [Bryobacteraceae bacterium]|nr:NADP-dependent oxidoreductase [Bryobacteraceae bacterium]
MHAINKQITLAARPSGMPKPDDFKLVESPVPEPGPGEFVVRILYVSVDPYMRGRMNDVKSYAPPVQIGEVMGAGAVGKVIASQNPQFQVGDVVEGFFGWQEYAVSNGTGVRKIDPSFAPVSTALGVLGMPGLTAYFGLLDIGKPRAGETVVVSGAAGAVGSLAGQIAKIQGCRVVGIAGSDSKVAWLRDEMGFDAAFNYKTTTNHTAKLAELCPKGVDVYFDNVGGAITDGVFPLINTGARIVVCGQIAMYNADKPETGPRLLWNLIVKQARAEGFLVFQFASRYAEGLKQMAEWLKAGKLKYGEQFVDGIENTPRAFIGMLQGENTGKQLVRVASE